MGKYQSGQMGQTVNLLAYAFGGSNPSLPTNGVQTSAIEHALIAECSRHYSNVFAKGYASKHTLFAF